MSEDFSKELRDLSNRIREVLRIVDTNPKATVDLLNGIKYESAGLLQTMQNIPDNTSKLKADIIMNIQFLIYTAGKMHDELEKEVYNKKEIDKFLPSLIKTKSYIDKVLPNINSTVLGKIREMSGFKKFLILLGLQSMMSQTSAKSDLMMNYNNLNPKISNTIIMNNPTTIPQMPGILITSPKMIDSLNTKANPASNAIIQTAQQQLGKKYVWKAVGPNSFDCSGLVQYVYGKNGIEMPRTSIDQSREGQQLFSGKIDTTKLMPGDLLFFAIHHGKKVVDHVGIYVGSHIDENGKLQVIMIHAPQTGERVKYANINTSYWLPKVVVAKRVLGENNNNLLASI